MTAPVGSSPVSTGPAGAEFEGQVGATYLLALLTNASPRGLPGTLIDRVQFQRAGEGYPLDDVIVHAHNMRGEPSVLRLQVKRSLTAAPKDPEFAAAVAQAGKAVSHAGFWERHEQLAVAFGRASRALLGPYPDVLLWARQMGTAREFFERMDRSGVANDDMRTFVTTVRDQLAAAGWAGDDELLWRLLRRFHLLRFDLTVEGSEGELIAVERCARALHEHDGARARSLWGNLVELAINTASSGGELTRELLQAELTVRGFRLGGVRSLAPHARSVG